MPALRRPPATVPALNLLLNCRQRDINFADHAAWLKCFRVVRENCPAKQPFAAPTPGLIHGRAGLRRESHQPQLGFRGPTASFWVFLARGRSFANTPLLRLGFPWISLDFLGFSRQNLDLSMGYTGFRGKIFSRAFSPGVKIRRNGSARSRPCRRAGLFMGQA
jgi:hypothetical protein